MTENFDIFFHQFLEDLSAGSVYGNSGEYDTSDVRTPKILGTYTRRGKLKRKKRKKRKIVKEQTSINKVTPEMDAEYKEAIKKGKIKIAQSIVDKVAKLAGYTVEGFHGTAGKIHNTFIPTNKGINTKGIENRPAIFFAVDKDHAEMFAKHASNSVGDIPVVLKAYLNIGKSVEKFSTDESIETLRASGVSSTILRDIESGKIVEYAVFEPNQIKSADPVTYDDSGKIIPLSQRFNKDSSDIRY